MRAKYPFRLQSWTSYWCYNTLNVPPTIQVQPCQPDPIHRIRALVPPFSIQVRGIHEFVSREGIGKVEVDDRSNMESTVQYRSPDALWKEARTGTQGVSWPARFQIINAPDLKYQSSSEVGSNCMDLRDLRNWLTMGSLTGGALQKRHENSQLPYEQFTMFFVLGLCDIGCIFK